MQPAFQHALQLRFAGVLELPGLCGRSLCKGKRPTAGRTGGSAPPKRRPASRARSPCRGSRSASPVSAWFPARHSEPRRYSRGRFAADPSPSPARFDGAGQQARGPLRANRAGAEAGPPSCRGTGTNWTPAPRRDLPPLRAFRLVLRARRRVPSGNQRNGPPSGTGHCVFRWSPKGQPQPPDSRPRYYRFVLNHTASLDAWHRPSPRVA